MEENENSTPQKLLKAITQLKKISFRDKQIAGYNPSEINVLLTIRRGTSNEKTDMKVSEISSLLHVTPPTVTQIINKLEKDGLVVRNIDPEDRRAVQIRLTNSGLEVVTQAGKYLSKVLSGLIDFLGEEESKKLADQLTKVYEYYQNSLR